MKELRGQMVVVPGMLCRRWGSWHPQVRKCRQNTRRCANTLVKFTGKKKIYSCSLSAPSGLDASRDVEILLSLQFSLLNLEKKEKHGENQMKRANGNVRDGKALSG